MKTAPQILEHYFGFAINGKEVDPMLKAMRHYARVKSEKAYEEGYKTAINQMK